MQAQINTDHNIEDDEALAAQVRSIVEASLGLEIAERRTNHP